MLVKLVQIKTDRHVPNWALSGLTCAQGRLCCVEKDEESNHRWMGNRRHLDEISSPLTSPREVRESGRKSS